VSWLALKIGSRCVLLFLGWRLACLAESTIGVFLRCIHSWESYHGFSILGSHRRGHRFNSLYWHFSVMSPLKIVAHGVVQATVPPHENIIYNERLQ
jgi:hypothetical protein